MSIYKQSSIFISCFLDDVQSNILLTMFYLLLTDTCSMTYHLHYHKNRDPSLEA